MSIIAFQPLFLVFLIILGFLVLYIFKKILLVEIGTSFEFYYLSIISSLFIYMIAILLYGFRIQQIKDLNDLISILADIRLLVLLLAATIIVFLIFYILYILNLPNNLRKLIGLEREIETYPHLDIWELVLKKSSYIIVLTKDGKKYYGYHKYHSFKGERMLLLHDVRMITDDYKIKPVMNELDSSIDSIMFFEEDIKRIYFLKLEKVLKNKGKRFI